MAAKAGSVYEGVMGLNETNAKFAKRALGVFRAQNEATGNSSMLEFT